MVLCWPSGPSSKIKVAESTSPTHEPVANNLPPSKLEPLPKKPGDTVRKEELDGSTEPVFEATNGPRLRAQDMNRVKVRGKVLSVSLAPSGKILFLNFGRGGQDCLVVKIFLSNFHKWENEAAGIRAQYVGKFITFEGVVKIYKDKDVPEIYIDSPMEITIEK